MSNDFLTQDLKKQHPQESKQQVIHFHKETYIMPKNIEFNKRGFSKQETSAIILEAISSSSKEQNKSEVVSDYRAGKGFLPLRLHRALDAVGIILEWKKFYQQKTFEEKKNISFTEEEYVKAYGVLYFSNKRGWKQVSDKEKQEAIKALRELHNKDVLISYKEIDKETGDKITKPLKDTVLQYFGCTRQSKNGQILKKYHEIRLNPFLWGDAVKSNYILKPTNWQATLKSIDKKDRKIFDQFMTIVWCDCNKKGNKRVVKKSIQQWAIRLNMMSYIEQRKWKNIKSRINKIIQYGLDSKLIKKTAWTDDGKNEFLNVEVTILKSD